MISKPFELQNHLDKKIFLLYGENNGQKEEIIDKFFKQRHLNSVYNYSEKEVFLNLDNFYNQINSQSFFEDKKLIIINYVSEKFKEEILNLLNKNLEDLTIILIAGILEKKSKIRNFFEKEKNLIIVPFYKDNDKTLADIARIFFNERRVSVSQETINIISQKASGDRQNLKNELKKIENFLGSKKKLNSEDALKLTNLSENYSIKDLVNHCLAKNQKDTLKIINENVFVLEDCITITRSILIAANRLLKLLQKPFIPMNNNPLKDFLNDQLLFNYTDVGTTQQYFHTFESHLKNYQSIESIFSNIYEKFDTLGKVEDLTLPCLNLLFERYKYPKPVKSKLLKILQSWQKS